MLTDELIERIRTAQEEFYKAKIEANTVILNGRKYGKLLDCGTPTIFGMSVLVDNLPNDYDFLLQYREVKKKTNGDRIRSMSDKELASWIFRISNCPCEVRIDNCGRSDITCRAAWLDWLEQETTE